jgi:site-specific recombinase XerD
MTSEQTGLIILPPQIAALAPRVTDQWLDQHPATNYLRRYAGHAERTMRSALNALAGFWGVPEVRDDAGRDMRYLFVPWEELRREDTMRLYELINTCVHADQDDVDVDAGGERGPTEAPRRLSFTTANKYRAALRGVLGECFQLGLMNGDDYQRAIKIPTFRGEAEPKGRRIEADEIEALLQLCAQDPGPLGRRDQAMVAVLYSTGVRRSELSAFNVEDYNTKKHTLKVRRGKGNVGRTVYVVGGAIEALERWIAVRNEAIGLEPKRPHPLFVSIRKGGHISTRRLTPGGVRDALVERVKAAMTDPLAPHDFRRTFISDLLEAGEDLSVAQKMAGHADIRTTAKYDHRGEKAKERAASRLRVPEIAPPATIPTPAAARERSRSGVRPSTTGDTENGQ